jgi:uncharacterized repeat protein (TIGR01451 family)
MNTKMNKGLIGLTLAFIMIASVFAAIAPSTTADVKAASNFQTAKETMNAAWTAIDPAMTYKVGDTARYIVNYTNTDPTFNCTLTLTDLLPDGTTYTFGTDVFFAVGQERVYYYNYTIKAGDVRAAGLDGVGYDHISNYARTDGLNENSEPITDNRGKFSRIVECATAVIANPGCFEEEGSYITFDGSQSYADPPNTIVNWSWTFSDGVHGSSDWSSTTSRDVNSAVTATLTVVDSMGCADSASVKVPPCTEVPLLTTLGVIALIGALSAVLLVSRYRKVH